MTVWRAGIDVDRPDPKGDAPERLEPRSAQVRRSHPWPIRARLVHWLYRAAARRRHRDEAHGHMAASALAVVVVAPYRIGEHLVSLGDLPKTPRRLGVLGMGVRVDAEGQAPVGAGDLLVGGRRGDLEAPVIEVGGFLA